MDIQQWIVENWPDILAWILAAVSYFLYLMNTLKVGKTRTLLDVQFKDRTAHVDDICAEIKKLGNALLSESKVQHSQVQKLVAEERAHTEQAIAEMREYTKQQIAEMKEYYESEIQKYRQSLLEISQNENTLVAKGVAETIAKRFEEKEKLSETNETESLKPIEEENDHETVR